MFRTAGHEAERRRASHALALRCQIRIEPQRRRYSRQRRSASTSCSARRPSGATPCARSCGPTSRRCIGRFDRLHRVRPARRVHLRLRGGRGQVHARAGATATYRCSSCSREPSSPAAVGLFGRATLLGRSRPRTGCPSPSGGGHGHLLPQQRLGARRRDTLERATAVPGLPACRPGIRPSRSSSRRRRRTAGDHRTVDPSAARRPVRGGPGGGRRRPLRGVRPLPLPGLLRKNQVRFQFGVLSPPWPQRGRRLRTWSARTECLVRPRTDRRPLTIRVRCLQHSERCGRGAGPRPRARRPAVRPRGRPRGGRDVPRRVGRGGRPGRSTSVRSPLAAWWPGARARPFQFDAGTETETVHGADGTTAGRLRASPSPVTVEVRVAPCRPTARRAVRQGDGDGREHHRMDGPASPPGRRAGPQPWWRCTPCWPSTAARSSPSSIPPTRAAPAALACRSEGTYPVLIGGDDVVLSSPIILYDHPEVAAQSPGDLYDAHRDRRDPGPAGDDPHRRGEGRGPGDRRPGRRHHRPLRRHVTRDVGACTAAAGPSWSRSGPVLARRRPRRSPPSRGGTRRPTRPSIPGRTRCGSEGSRWQRGRRSGSGPAARADAQDMFLAARRRPWPACSATSTATCTSPSRSTTTRRGERADLAGPLPVLPARRDRAARPTPGRCPMTGSGVLVAGIGNIFLRDDGFGVEVVHRLTGRALPDGVRVEDYGIRGIHLAYELLEGYDALVLVDAVPMGEPPGTWRSSSPSRHPPAHADAPVRRRPHHEPRRRARHPGPPRRPGRSHRHRRMPARQPRRGHWAVSPVAAAVSGAVDLCLEARCRHCPTGRKGERNDDPSLVRFAGPGR